MLFAGLVKTEEEGMVSWRKKARPAELCGRWQYSLVLAQFPQNSVIANF